MPTLSVPYFLCFRDALKTFFSMQNDLRYASLRSSNILDQALGEFSKRSRLLEYVDLSNCSKISGNLLYEIFNTNHNITTIKLRGLSQINLTDILNTIAKNCQALTVLDISEAIVDDSACLTLICANCPDLVEFTVRSTPVEDDAIQVLSKHGKIERLDLTLCAKITDFVASISHLLIF